MVPIFFGAGANLRHFTFKSLYLKRFYAKYRRSFNYKFFMSTLVGHAHFLLLIFSEGISILVLIFTLFACLLLGGSNDTEPHLTTV